MTAEASTPPMHSRPGWRTALVTSFLIVLGRPALVALALVGFLARGGIVALLLPIVVLPTPAGLANVFAPVVVPFVFGTSSPVVVQFELIGAAIAATWLILGGLAGGWADVTLIGEAATDEQMSSTGIRARHGRSTVGRVAIVRLLAHMPVVIVLVWGASGIYGAIFAELTSPFEVVTPLVIRILSDVPGAILAVAVSWVLGETAGGIGVRHLVLGNSSVAGAVAKGYLELIRRPRTSIATLVVTDLVVAAVVGVVFVASALSWTLVVTMVLDAGESAVVLAAVFVLAATWLGGLVLTGIACGIRSVAWTAEWLRPRTGIEHRQGGEGVEAFGTIGDSDEPRPGDWSSARPSGTV